MRSLLFRLLAPYGFALVAVAVCLSVYSDRVVERVYLDTLAETELRQAQLTGLLLPWDLRGEPLDRQCAALARHVQARVTVIAADGTVLGDSDARSESLENHADRSEIEAALRHGDGQSVRVSASVGRPLFYRAVREQRDATVRVVRLALPLPAIDATRRRIRGAILGGLLAAALAALWPALALARGLAGRFSRLAGFSRAVAQGRPPGLFAAERDDLLGELERNVTTMAHGLETQLAAARAERSKIEAILRGMAEGVVVTDDTGTIRLANERATALFDVPPDTNLIGRQLVDLSRAPELLGMLRACVEGGGAYPLVHEIAGGRHGSLQVTATPIAATSGEGHLVIFVFHDITRLKQLETTRRDFVANVSHELRTPLAAIRGFAETLRTGALEEPENARRFLAIIERHAERLGRLVDDLLTLSDLELGRSRLERAAVAVDSAVETAIDVLREKAGQAGITLVATLDTGLPRLLADPDRLQQILVNLIDNAIKYTPRGGSVTVTARRAATADAAGAIEIGVADTGIGIPSQDLPRLTERFYRVDQARSRELGGTGLGLAIVKHLVQLHGGRLTIESELHHGTTVRVFLPVDFR